MAIACHIPLFEVDSRREIRRNRHWCLCHDTVLMLIARCTLLPAHSEALDGDGKDNPCHEEGNYTHGYGEDEHGVQTVVFHGCNAVGCL